MNRFIDRRRQEELLKAAEQAAAWAIALKEHPGEKQRKRFVEWLEESALHLELFVRAEAIDRLGDMMSPDQRLRISEKRQALPDNATVVSLEYAKPSSRLVIPLLKRIDYLALKATVVLGIATLVIAMWLHGFGGFTWEHYQTAFGEQRSIMLSDGSVVHLNSSSEIAVRYRHAARDVRLISGEALFKVAHVVDSPFRVYADDALVEAVGTQFDIYRKSTQTIVAVVEGIVEVSQRFDGSNSAGENESSAEMQPQISARRLLAGQAVQVSLDGQLTEPFPISTEQVTAWRQRRLIFERERLDAIAAEFNRYNRMKIRIDDEAVGAIRFTAVFDVNEPQTLLQFLADERHLELERKGDELFIRKATNLTDLP